MSTKPHMSDEEMHWHGAKYLGNGSFGAVGLWCETDEQNNVVDRMVVKENATASREAWRDPKNFRDRLPREIAVHRRIEAQRAQEPEARQYIIKYRGHRLLMSKRRFRLYLDYASGGNLQKAMGLYNDKWFGIGFDDASPQDVLPEAFIWQTIKALATACLFLQNGTTSDKAVTDWKPIMHLDFQLPNILLDVQKKKRKSAEDESGDAPPVGPSKRRKGADLSIKAKVSIMVEAYNTDTDLFTGRGNSTHAGGLRALLL